MPNNLDMGGFATSGAPLFPLLSSRWTRLVNPTPARSNVAIGLVSDMTTIGPAFSLQLPDGGIRGGNVRGNYACDLQTYRFSASEVASGDYSFMAGKGCTASGAGSVALGSQSLANAATATAIGDGCQATGQYAASIGAFCSSSGTASVALGNTTTASGSSSFAYGRGSTTRGLTGAVACAAGPRSALGDAQHMEQIVRATTTDATTTTLTAGGAAAGSTTVMVLPNNSHVAGLVTITARDSAGNSASWLIFARVSRGANAASTAVDFQTTVASDLSATLAATTAVIAADTTSGALIVSATGIAATTIDWIADPQLLQIVR